MHGYQFFFFASFVRAFIGEYFCFIRFTILVNVLADGHVGRNAAWRWHWFTAQRTCRHLNILFMGRRALVLLIAEMSRTGMRKWGEKKSRAITFRYKSLTDCTQSTNTQTRTRHCPGHCCFTLPHRLCRSSNSYRRTPELTSALIYISVHTQYPFKGGHQTKTENSPNATMNVSRVLNVRSVRNSSKSSAMN